MIGLPFWIKQRLTVLLFGACIGLATAAFSAQGQITRAVWIRSKDHIELVIPLGNMLTSKQRSMIEGGFTTMSEFSLLKDTRMQATANDILWSLSCSVKFDAWDESYEVSRFLPTQNAVNAETAIVRKFADYGDLCLTARVPASPWLAHITETGEQIVGQLTVQQMSVEEGTRIKEWLVKQQSGLMQSLFKHMLGELSIHQTLSVKIAVPPLPVEFKQKLHDEGFLAPQNRGH